MSSADYIGYSIAGLWLSVARDLMVVTPPNKAPRYRLDSFTPFISSEAIDSKPDCIVKIANLSEQESKTPWSKDGHMKLLHSFEFSDADAICRFYADTNEESHSFLLDIEKGEELIVEFLCDSISGETQCRPMTNCSVDTESIEFNSFLRFGLWFSLGITAAKKMVAAVHSSTIVYREQAIMFLGESGTGKSTHTRLWRENIEGATLLNDDSPLIGFADGKPTVYGSPWSGKTPCYKNEQYPLRAIVRLSQAPHNKIRRIKGVAAIGALLPSLPPAFAFDEGLKEMMFEILSRVLASAEVYHLECLPNADAAKVVHQTLFEL